MSTVKKFNGFLSEKNKLVNEEYHGGGKLNNSINVLFGEGAVDAFENEEYDDVLDNGTIIKREFNTDGERKAYIQGLNDMAGNEEYVILSDDDIKLIEKQEEGPSDDEIEDIEDIIEIEDDEE